MKTISIVYNQHDDEEDSNLTKILVSKYLFILSFCISIVNVPLTGVMLYVLTKTKKLMLNKMMYYTMIQKYH